MECNFPARGRQSHLEDISSLRLEYNGYHENQSCIQIGLYIIHTAYLIIVIFYKRLLFLLDIRNIRNLLLLLVLDISENQVSF